MYLSQIFYHHWCLPLGSIEVDEQGITFDAVGGWPMRRLMQIRGPKRIPHWNIDGIYVRGYQALIEFDGDDEILCRAEFIRALPMVPYPVREMNPRPATSRDTVRQMIRRQEARPIASWELGRRGGLKRTNLSLRVPRIIALVVIVTASVLPDALR